MSAPIEIIVKHLHFSNNLSHSTNIAKMIYVFDNISINKLNYLKNKFKPPVIHKHSIISIKSQLFNTVITLNKLVTKMVLSKIKIPEYVSNGKQMKQYFNILPPGKITKHFFHFVQNKSLIEIIKAVQKIQTKTLSKLAIIAGRNSPHKINSESYSLTEKIEFSKQQISFVLNKIIMQRELETQFKNSVNMSFKQLYDFIKQFKKIDFRKLTNSNESLKNNKEYNYEKGLYIQQIEFINNMENLLKYKLTNKRKKKVIETEFIIKKLSYYKNSNIIPTSFIGGQIGDLYTRLYNNAVYKSLPSQAAQQAAHQNIESDYKSYFELHTSHKKAQPPGYIKKDGYKPITWKTQYKFKKVNSKVRKTVKRYVYLSIGCHNKGKTLLNDMLEENKTEFSLAKNSIIGKPICQEDKYYKSKLHTDIKISYTHFQFPVSKEIYNMKEKIQLIRIVPKEDAKFFEMHITLKKQIKQVSSVIERILSIDPGVINIATIASNIPTLRPWIISGKEITTATDMQDGK